MRKSLESEKKTVRSLTNEVDTHRIEVQRLEREQAASLDREGRQREINLQLRQEVESMSRELQLHTGAKSSEGGEETLVLDEAAGPFDPTNGAERVAMLRKTILEACEYVDDRDEPAPSDVDATQRLHTYMDILKVTITCRVRSHPLPRSHSHPRLYHLCRRESV